jgi:hypothetical protein
MTHDNLTKLTNSSSTLPPSSAGLTDPYAGKLTPTESNWSQTYAQGYAMGGPTSMDYSQMQQSYSNNSLPVGAKYWS